LTLEIREKEKIMDFKEAKWFLKELDKTLKKDILSNEHSAIVLINLYDEDYLLKIINMLENLENKKLDLSSEKKEVKLRVWYIPQLGNNAPIFRVKVESVEEAEKLLDTMWNYDIFQFENHIKPDYCNASGLEYYDEELGEWQEYYDEEGRDIDEIIKNDDRFN
jgi:hypothetical protein